MFIDEAIIRVRGGRGGNGVIHFMSSPHNYHGGPDGGSGGDGGDIILQSAGNISTLYRFRHRPLFEADHGVNGARQNQQGARGNDTVVMIPVGTVIRDTTSGEMLADLGQVGEQVVVARGGEGGRGNNSFTTSTRQAPRICERGLGGEARTLKLELKLIADVGIIGYPNAGKSSLISSISGVKAKVADYPFTTLTPNLGVVDVDGIHQFVAVDIPGLIEGAHEGRGLGDRFLRHIERTSLFIHMIDLAVLEEDRDPVEDFNRINHELASFNESLGLRPQIVVLNKVDAVDDACVEQAMARFKEQGIEAMPVSVATRQGVRELVNRTYYMVKERREQNLGETTVVRKAIYRFEGETGFSVEREDDAFVVRGTVVEKLVEKLVLDHRDAQEYLGDRLEKMGVFRELRRNGFEDGDIIRIGTVELEFEG